jgi:hypothetical protein
MNRLQIGIIDSGSLSLQVHLPEHIQSATLFDLAAVLALGRVINAIRLSPASIRVAPEDDGVAVVAGGNNLVLPGPDQACKRQHLGSDSDNRVRGLLGCRWVDDGN